MMNEIFLGVRVWIWLYLVFSILAFAVVGIYFFREWIRKQYYKIRFPEKLIRIVIHYKTNHFKIFWRIIPDTDTLKVDNKTYAFNSSLILNPDDVFSKEKKGTGLVIGIEGKWYKIDNLLKIKSRFNKYPELHYFYNAPNPINFDMSKKKIEFSSKQLKEFKENDLFSKLLTLDTQSTMIFLVLVVSAIGGLISLVMLARDMGWIS